MSAPLSPHARRLLRAIPADGGKLFAVAKLARLDMPAATKAAVELYRARLLANVAPVTLNADGWQARRDADERRAA